MRRRGSIISFCTALALGTALLRVTPASAQLANGAPAWFLIDTQNANSSSSLQFTTSTATWSQNYNRLFLNCQGLIPSVSGATLALKVGESTGWETGANYTVVDTTSQAGGQTDIIAGQMLGMTTSTPTYLQAYIDNPGSSSIVKNVAVYIGGGNTTTGGGVTSTCCGYNEWSMQGAGQLALFGYWDGDTNPLTGIELVPSSGTISSGSCSLYGFQ
jgi:hypothetical protein